MVAVWEAEDVSSLTRREGASSRTQKTMAPNDSLLLWSILIRIKQCRMEPSRKGH